MKMIAPTWVTDFHCIADQCRHSCCVGWEIDIDKESVSRYLRMSGDIGERLRRALVKSDGGWHFRMGRDGRCAMLEENGLCGLILSRGEGALCDICREHPRYYHEYTGRVEMGIGLCCEEAARLQLTCADPLARVTLQKDAGPERLTAREAAFFRARDQLMKIAASPVPMARRLNALSAAAGLPEEPQPPLTFWLEMERLDEHWTLLLQRLMETKTPDEDLAETPAEISVKRAAEFGDEPLAVQPDEIAAQTLNEPSAHSPAEKPAIPFAGLPAKVDAILTRWLTYLLWRHLPDSLNGSSLQRETRLCLRLTRLLADLCALPGAGPMTYARMLSGEVEYSAENLGRAKSPLQ